jgi:hypothetical protein
VTASERHAQVLPDLRSDDGRKVDAAVGLEQGGGVIEALEDVALALTPKALVAILQHTATRMAIESKQPQVPVRRSLSRPGIIREEGIRV